MDGRRWKRCPKGHVLGEIVRVDVSGNGRRRYATRLRLYRHAVETPPADNDPAVSAVLEGTAPVLYCDLCQGQGGRWEIGAEALEYLLETRMVRCG